MTAHTGRTTQSHGSSPAQRYAAFQKRRLREKSMAYCFEQTLPFELDDFQREANDALERGDNVLLAAPTGAGKTVVADFAIFLAHDRNVKAFYTTPIKALSNQKYHDLVQVYGADNVGLLTGDTSVNPEADILVMTTEVLRNMLYEHSITLDTLGYVILDEIHYLANKFRGAVWEEVIIHLPAYVKIIGLSATVSNVEDFSQWVSSVRGSTHLIVNEHRPVALQHHVIIQKDQYTEPELCDLYDTDKRGKQTTRVNVQLATRLAQWDYRASKRHEAHRDRNTRNKSHAGQYRAQRNPRSSRYTPKRWAVIDELDYLNMLPGIYFIFSRNGCDQAVSQCLQADLCLTSQEEMLEIRHTVAQMIHGQLSQEDLKALHFEQFSYALELGFASHHAGMIALFRHIVETLFTRGLLKVVFATETLALGVNMPARSVIVEKLTKFDGSGHTQLTPGEFTQLTGRAGRRGIDEIGHAVLVDYADFNPAVAATLSSRRVYPLHSSFAPTFNMAVNLLQSSDVATARTTLNRSFAQWEAEAQAQRLLARLDELQKALDGYEQAFACKLGDFAEFMTIRMQLKHAQHDERKVLKHTLFTNDDQRKAAFDTLDEKIHGLVMRARNHPCTACPDFHDHERWGLYWAREKREYDKVYERYQARTGSVGYAFDKICNILCELDYVHPAGDGSLELTDRGKLLRRLYNELDIVFAQGICEGLFNDLSPEELAAVLSALVYEARGSSSSEPRRYPGGVDGKIFTTVAHMKVLFMHMSALCANQHLDALRPLDFGGIDLIYDWAQGADLSQILRHSDMTGGDFVRFAKRLVDLLTQLACASDVLERLNGVDPDLSKKASQAADAIHRGVVSYSDVTQS